MADIVTSKTWVDGEKGVTAVKMNQIISEAVIQPAFYSAKASSPTLDPTDVLLELKGTGSFAQITGSQLIASVGTTLSVVTSFITKTAAYALLPSDSNKYVICSGGSWVLTLPTPAPGLIYRVRNDMGISGTTGTITLQTSGGTIDGLVSIPLLPQQDCTIITDGTNWRTFGKQREVVLGTIDITSSTADSGTILLPAGFRYFLAQFHGLISSVDATNFAAQLSFDGGATWQTASYYYGQVIDASATTVSYAHNTNVPYMVLGLGSGSTGTVEAMSELTLFPGTAAKSATFISKNGVYTGAGARLSSRWINGFLNVAGVANAMHFYVSAANMLQCFFTLKGVV